MKLREAIKLYEEIENIDLVRVEMAVGHNLETALNRVIEGSTWVIELGFCYSLEACYRELGHGLTELNGILENTTEELSNYFDFESYGRDAVLSGDFTIIGANEGMDQNYAVCNN